MENRQRRVQVHFYITEEEYDFILRKMARAKTTNFSRYARDMLLNGYVIHQDFSTLKELAITLGRLSGSINQIAKRCNETGSVHAWQVEELKRGYADVKRACTERLVKMAEE